MSSTKFGFRPRALDVTRKLPIRIRKCKKRSLKVKRNVALASSGMEKEEEMESHLQQALLAQKATSAGDSVENHVIPTPKVLSLNEDEYDRIYQQQRRFQKGKRLITFKEHVPFFLTQGSYNADSEDEDWLNTRRNIQLDDFEHIIEKLETASQTDIIKPKNAKILLQRYDTGLIEDVYDYWLQKRQKAASRKSKCPVLMPRVSSDVKKEEKTIVNPYIAFRRRLDKVQTRKKQKTELMTYEKMLQINFVMKRSIVLIGTLTQREKLKRAACEMEYSLYQLQTKRRISAEQCEHFVEECQREQQIGMENSQQMMEASTSGIGGLMAMKDSELIDELKRSIIEPNSWRNGQFPQMDKNLQKNLELWNAAALITPFIAAATSIDDDSAEVEKIAAVEQNSSIDGRYQFKRKHGCHYRAPLHHNNNNNNENDQNQQQQSPSTTTTFIDDELISGPFHHSITNNTIAANSMYTEVICQNGDDNIVRRLWFRKRMGRGGRLLIDRVMISSQQRPSPPPPPTEQPQKDLNL